MGLHLSVDLPEDLALLPQLRRTLRDALNLCRIAPDDVDELELMVGELAANAVCHANSGHYNVDVELNDLEVITTVADKGAGFDRNLLAPQGTLRSDHQGTDRIGGWGLPLVELLSDEVTFLNSDPHGTTIRSVKHLRPLLPVIVGFPEIILSSGKVELPRS